MMVLVSTVNTKYLSLVLGVLLGFVSLVLGSASFAFSTPGVGYGTDGGNAQLRKACVTTLVIPEVTNAYPNTFSGGNSNMAFATTAAASVRNGGVLCPGTYTVSFTVVQGNTSCGHNNCYWNINQVTDANGDNLIASQRYNDGIGTDTHSATSATGAYNTETGGALSPIQASTDNTNTLYISSLVVTLTGTSRLP